MKTHFYRHRNLLIEVLLAPHLMFETSSLLNEQTLNAAQINFIQDILDSTEHLQHVSKEFKEVFDECMLSNNSRDLALSCYFHLLKQGHDPHTPEELFELFAHMSKDDLLTSMRNCLEIENDDFLSAIRSIEDMEPEIRWYWLSATTSPVAHMQKMLTLLHKTTPLYLQEREQYKAEYENSVSIIEHYSLEDILSRIITLDETAKMELVNHDGELDVYILSSPFLLFMLAIRENLNDPEPHIAFITPRIEEVLNLGTTTNESIKNVLKILSDPTSYRILQLLTSTNLKAKDIAEQLNITSAAVSYHTQKLAVHKMITFNTSHHVGKYSLNRDLLKQVLTNISRDFDIDR